MIFNSSASRKKGVSRKKKPEKIANKQNPSQSRFQLCKNPEKQGSLVFVVHGFMEVEVFSTGSVD